MDSFLYFRANLQTSMAFFKSGKGRNYITQVKKWKVFFKQSEDLDVNKFDSTPSRMWLVPPLSTGWCDVSQRGRTLVVDNEQNTSHISPTKVGNEPDIWHTLRTVKPLDDHRG